MSETKSQTSTSSNARNAVVDQQQSVTNVDQPVVDATQAEQQAQLQVQTQPQQQSWLRNTWTSYKWYIIAIAVLCAACVMWSFYKQKRLERRRRQIDQQCAQIPESESIFVSIASYRDPQCAYTLFDLFDKAACPFRITVGVCQQNYTAVDQDAGEKYKSMARDSGVHDFSHHIRIMRMSAEQAQGPMYARHLIEKHLYRGEKYYLIVDSHMLFTPNWDVECVKMYNQCLVWSPKPILTMYPEDFKPYNRTWTMSNYENEPGSYLRFKKFNEKTNVVEIEGPRFKRKPSAPQLALFWAGCFSFGSASQIKEVPYDGFGSFVFLGEEISMAARLWTSGYDLYHPQKMVVYHMWKRNRPTFWQLLSEPSVNESHQKRQQMEKQGYQRIRSVLGIEDPSQTLTVTAPFNLGTTRTLAEYENFIGIRMSKQQFTHLGGVLGLPISSSSADILNRFGTWNEYKKMQMLAGDIIRQRQQGPSAVSIQLV